MANNMKTNSEIHCFHLKTIVCMQKFILLVVKRRIENDPPIHPDVLRLGRVDGIIGNSNWPRPSNDDIMLLIQILPEKYSHIYLTFNIYLFNKALIKTDYIISEALYMKKNLNKLSVKI